MHRKNVVLPVAPGLAGGQRVETRVDLREGSERRLVGERGTIGTPRT